MSKRRLSNSTEDLPHSFFPSISKRRMNSDFEVLDVSDAKPVQSFGKVNLLSSDDTIEILSEMSEDPSTHRKTSEIVDLSDEDDDHQTPTEATTAAKDHPADVENENTEGLEMVTINYSSIVPGFEGEGTFRMPKEDSFEEFVKLFGSNRDEIVIVFDDFETDWYSSPEVLIEGDEDSLFLRIRKKGQDNPDTDARGPIADDTYLIKVNCADNTQIPVRVKPTTTFAKIASYVGEQKNYDPSKLQLVFDGDKVDFDDMVRDQDLEEDDVIDARYRP